MDSNFKSISRSNASAKKSIPKLPLSGRFATNNFRSMNSLELQIIKTKLDLVWKDILLRHDESSYSRSVRVNRLLSENGAAKLIQDNTLNCSRIFLSRGKLFVEENSNGKFFADPIATIYKHGFLSPHKLGPKLIEAPLSVSKFLFY